MTHLAYQLPHLPIAVGTTLTAHHHQLMTKSASAIKTTFGAQYSHRWGRVGVAAQNLLATNKTWSHGTTEAPERSINVGSSLSYKQFEWLVDAAMGSSTKVNSGIIATVVPSCQIYAGIADLTDQALIRGGVRLTMSQWSISYAMASYDQQSLGMTQTFGVSYQY